MNGRTHTTQKGMVLIIGLIMLLLLTILGLASSNIGFFEIKMSGNMQDKEKAFQSAESALIAGEKWLEQQTTEPVPTTSCGTSTCVLNFDNTRHPENQTGAWWLANSTVSTDTLTDVNAQPRYLIEYVSFVPDSLVVGNGKPTGASYYYVTARGVGAGQNAQSVLQSSYSKRY